MSGTTVPCRRCGGTLRFIRTREGKAMPVEPVPNPDGNVAALKTSRGRYIDAHVIRPDEDRDALAAGGYSVFMPHFAVCRDEGPAKRQADQTPLF